MIIIVVAVVAAGAIYFLQQPSDQNIYSNNSPAPSTQNNSPAPQTPAEEENASPKTYNITLQNFSFNPSELNIKKGDTVTWTNQDSAPHTILANSFQSNTLSKGQNFSFTFNASGAFEYICSIHPSMKGKIIVQ